MPTVPAGSARAVLLFCVLLASASLFPGSHAENITLSPNLVAPGTYNRLSVTITYSGTGGGNDTESTDASGTLPVELQVNFAPDQAATVTGIRFIHNQPGTVYLSNMHFEWTYLFVFSVWIDSNDIRATGNTPSPFSVVTGGSFPSDNHQIIMNHGIITPGTTAPVEAPTPVDLSATPAATTTYAKQGSVIVSAPSIAGNTATYTVTVTYPIDFDNDIDANTNMKGSGTIRATGQFSRQIPPPSVTTGTGATAVAGSSATLNGELLASGSYPADIDIAWGRLDAGTSSRSDWESSISLGARSAGTFSTAIAIQPNQDYAYRCRAGNAYGSDWSDAAEHFAIPLAKVRVTNGNGATGTAPDSATLTGQLRASIPLPSQVFMKYDVEDKGTNAAAWSWTAPAGEHALKLIETGAPARALVPTADMGTQWTALTYDDSGWAAGSTGVGYDDAPDYDPLVGLDVGTAMNGSNATCYIRVPFTVSYFRGAGDITLRMKYDDGFVAYLNGVEVARANAPDRPQWDSSATANHADPEAVVYRDFLISSFTTDLRVGSNVLAIQGLNDGATSSDFLIVPELIAELGDPVAMTTDATIAPNTLFYYRCFATNAYAAACADSANTFWYALPATLPFEETFESTQPGMAGTIGRLHPQHGWEASALDSARVQDGDASEGSQSCAFSNAVLTHAFADERTNVWVEMYAKPVPGETTFEAGESAAVFWVDASNRVCVCDGPTVRVLTNVTVNPGAWVRFVAHADYGTRRWELWVGREEVARDLELGTGCDALRVLKISQPGTGTAAIDDLLVGLVAPPRDPGDTDADGMPDPWEERHFGDLSQTAAGDWDGDGLSNAGEWRAGTVPTNAESVLAVSQLSGDAATGIVLYWRGVTGRTYRIQGTDRLAGNSWSNISPSLPGTDPMNVYTDLLGNSTSQYYRVGLE